MARDSVRAGKHPFPGRFRLLRAGLKLIRAQTDKVKFDPAGIENPVNMGAASRVSSYCAKQNMRTDVKKLVKKLTMSI